MAMKYLKKIFEANEMLDTNIHNDKFIIQEMRYLKTYKIFESTQELSVDLVKDILLSIYEQEFDSHRFEFFERKKEGYEIDFIPEDKVIYFNIEKDTVNKEGSIKISVLCKPLPNSRHDILTSHSEEKINELNNILLEYEYHLSKPPSHRPHDACFVLHPSRDNVNNLVYTTLRESRYSVIPN